jgi:hypothetical protein
MGLLQERITTTTAGSITSVQVTINQSILATTQMLETKRKLISQSFYYIGYLRAS